MANTRFWSVQVYLSILLKLLTPARARFWVHVSALIAWLARRWGMTFQDSFVYQDVGDEDGGRDARLGGQPDRFLHQWLTNLKDQGHSLSPEARA